MSTETITPENSTQLNSKPSTEESKKFIYAELKEKLEKLSEVMVKLDNVSVDLEPGILDIVLPTFENILNIFVEKGTVQTGRRLLKWTESQFKEIKKSVDGDKRVNPFLNPTIIQHLTLPEINPDDKTLRNLRQLSTLHHQILNSKYFDQVEIAIKINRWEIQILYGPSPPLVGPLPPTPMELMKLDPETWDPITLAPTIRRLILNGTELDYLTRSWKSPRPRMIGGFNPLELISQITPYVTTLSLQFMGFISDGNKTEVMSTNLSGFIRQFMNLKCLKLQTGSFWEPSDLYNFQKILMKIDSEVSGEFEIEFELLLNFLRRTSYPEIPASPERCFITKNHKFSLNILHTPTFREGIFGSREIGTWAKILTIANNLNLIPLKYFGVKLILRDFRPSKAARNEILNDFPTMSPYIVELDICNDVWGLDNLLFTSQSWPRLKTLKICSEKAQLLGLLALCPNLENFTLKIVEQKSIFTNRKLTDEDNLKQIFGGCSNTLKKLTFVRNENIYNAKLKKSRKIVPGSKLLKYLQELLPNTLVEAEEVNTAEDSESEESSDSESEESSDSSSNFSESE